MIPVVDPETGKTGYIDPKFAPEVASTGLVAPTAKQMRHAQNAADVDATRADLDAQYDGTLEGAVAPALAGAARGLTLGGSDVAFGHLGAGVRKRLLDYQDYAPVASTLGEVGAIAGSALLGDEAGLGRIPGMVTRLGEGAGTAVAERLGGGMAARVAARAASGAAEGAIYAAGKAEGDAALHNEQLTTEKAVSAIGHGALFGAGTNVLLGGAGAGLSKLLGREEGELAGVASGAARADRAESTGLGDALQKGADVKTIKALGGSAGDLKSLEANVPGGFRKVAQDIRGDIESSTGKSIGFHNRESLHEYASTRKLGLGEELGGMLKKIDEVGGGAAPESARFVQQVREEVLSKFLIETPTGTVVAPGAGKVVKAVEGYLSEIEAVTNGRTSTFTEWQGWRKNLDKEIYKGTVKASPSVDALRQVRALMEKELEVSGEAAAKNMGGSFVEQYRATKSLYQSVAKAEELTARGVAAELSRNSLGLGATIGAATGLATGGPLGGIAMGIAGKVVKDRGDMMAADLLHRAANLAGVQSLAARTDASISKGVAGLLGAKLPVAASAASAVRVPVVPMGVALSGNLRGDYKKVSEEVVKSVANPTATTDRVARALGPEAAKSPKVAAAATQLMIGDIDFLHKQMPPPRFDAFSLQPHLQTDSRASDSEMQKFMDQAKVLANPTMVLDEAVKGTLSRVHVEALKERRPEMYQAIRTEVMEQVASTTKEIPYDRRIQLGILLDIPTDRTLAPDFMRAIQATYSSAEKAGEESPSPQLSRPLAIASGPMTSTQAAMSEGLEK